VDDAGAASSVRLVGAGTAVCNPAFDVTPARLVTALVTEQGASRPGELSSD
jgi:methylthioribose-1-phosphate isomerase